MEFRLHQHLTCRIQNYPIISSDESLTDQRPITSSTCHVSSTEVLARRLIGTCSGRPQITELSQHVYNDMRLVPSDSDISLSLYRGFCNKKFCVWILVAVPCAPLCRCSRSVGLRPGSHYVCIVKLCVAAQSMTLQPTVTEAVESASLC